jgi:RND superfamily putative drug exporter
MLAATAAFLPSRPFSGAPAPGLPSGGGEDFEDPDPRTVQARQRLERAAGAGNSVGLIALLQRTGRIVTAAVLLFTVAIGALATSQIIFTKEVGSGTTLAVLIDATIVRALLVPSLIALLGQWNWWAAEPPRRLHAGPRLSEA